MSINGNRTIARGKLSWFARLVFSVALAFPAQAVAEPMRTLAPDERAEFSAVGRVNGVGYRRLQGCSGTLIAPDLVLTAAHCVGSEGIGPQRHFVAGWDRGSFLAHRVSERIAIHPAYSKFSEPRKYEYDMAVIELADPISERIVRPITPELTRRRAPASARLLGYHNLRPHVLGGHDSCGSVSETRLPGWLFECEVHSGNSGGAALDLVDNDWKIVGVIVARGNRDGDALVAPVNQWLMGEWQRAMTRAAKRP